MDITYDQAVDIFASYLENGYQYACRVFGQTVVNYVVASIEHKEAFK